MDSPVENIFTILDSPDASLIIYLLSSALLMISLMVNYQFWRRNSAVISWRLTISLALMLLVELAALTATALLNSDPQTGNSWLPPIDRFQMAFLLVWVMWIWAFPESTPWADILTVLITFALLAAFILTLTIWPLAAPGSNFNAHWLDLGWQVGCLGYLILMVIIIYIRRMRLWGAGLLAGLLFISGHTLQIIFSGLTDNYSGPVRLVTLIALPLLLILPQGYPSTSSEAHATALRRGRDKRDRRRFSTELPTALGFLSLAWEDIPITVMQLLVKSIGRALLADICLFTTPPNQNNQVTILAGYDFYNHTDIKETRLDRQRIPMIIDALNNSRSFRLSEDYRDTPDAAYLCRLVRFNGNAPLLFHPVSKPNAWQVGGILLLTPYSRRAWTQDDSRYITGLTEALIRIIERKQVQLETASHTQKLAEEQRESGQIIISLQNELQELSVELDKFQTRIAELESKDLMSKTSTPPFQTDTQPEPASNRRRLVRDATVQLNPQVVEKYDNSKEIARLQDENNALRQLIAHISSPPEEADERPLNQTERELRLSLEEVARLKNMLADADMKLRQLERKVQGGA
jgi:hypothetical protein